MAINKYFYCELTDNHVLPSGMAMVDGKPTGLAGCADSDQCARASNCLRADSKLDYRAPFLGFVKDEPCRSHISIRMTESEYLSLR